MINGDILGFFYDFLKENVSIVEIANVRNKLVLKKYTVTKNDNIALLLLLFKETNAKAIHKYLSSLKNWDLLKYFHPQIADMERIQQTKAGCIIDNNLDHTLRTVKSMDMFDIRKDTVFKLACLYHDIGKGLALDNDGKFLKHPEYSARIFIGDFIQVLPYSGVMRGYFLIKNHMLPHAILAKNKQFDNDYKRRFVDSCNGFVNAYDTIRLAMVDKAASHKEKYLEQYYRMLKEYEEHLEDCYFKSEYCPICAIDGAEKELSIFAEYDGKDVAYCEFCKTTFYFDSEKKIIPTNRIDIFSEGTI
jgi:hypothetical protein